jgi:divalent metal cation (Fe/Co/Zn/Cd) transporter
VTSPVVTRDQLLTRGLRLEYLTVGWNIVEGLVAVGAGVAAGSIALIGFGADSFIECISGAVLIWRLRAEAAGADAERVEFVERRAQRLVAVSFMVLAAYVAVEALRSLVGQDRPEASLVGIALTAISLVVMLWLARAKRETGMALGSPALIADAHQTFACWYLSATTLAGLALNATLGLWWADPVAALVIAVFLVREAREAWAGEEHGD